MMSAIGSTAPHTPCKAAVEARTIYVSASVTVVGVRGHLVAVEAHVGRGLLSLTLTGLPGATVQGALATVQGALAWIRPTVESTCVEWPLRRVVANCRRATSARRVRLELPV